MYNFGCTTVTSAGASATAAQIQAAWTSALDGTYVSLAAGTYSLACLSLTGNSNVALRGAGANQTIINATGSCSGAGISVANTGGTNEGSPASVTPVSGHTGALIQGQNTAILSSVANLVVGNPLIFDQNDSTTDNGGILVLGSPSSYTGPFTAPGNAGPYSVDGESQNARCPGGTSSPSTCFHQEQIVFVTSCNGATTVGTACTGTNVVVGFDPPLQMPNWSSTNTMSAWWATSPIQYAGVEDLTINMTSSSGTDGIYLTHCSNCWVKGVSVIDTNLAHVRLNYSANDTINNSYFFLTQNHVTSSYGVDCDSCSRALFENNIFHGIASPVIWNGTSNGNVVGYNFNANDYYTASTGFSQNFYGEHSGGVDTNLLEGNITQNWMAGDNIHGTGNLTTFFRNVISGLPGECYASGSTYATTVYEPCNNPLVPFQIQSYHRFYSVIGNVLGTSGHNTSYLGNESFSNSDVYSLGLGDSVPNDPNVNATIMLWGNADSATGFTAPRFNANEIMAGTAFVSLPTSQQLGFNPVPANQTLPASFYYTAKPSWWPAGKPWPLIGPDISAGNLLTCTGGSQTTSLVTNSSQCPSGTTAAFANSLASSNPAMDCYLSLGGLANGTGPQLSNFNEAACYAISAVPIFSPSSINFGTVIQNTTSGNITATLTNYSSSVINFSSGGFSGANASDFAIASSTCGNFSSGSLIAGASCTVTFNFTPTATPIASESATFSVAYTGATGSPATISLSGTSGGAPIIGLAPASYNFGTVAVGSNSTTTVVATNTGTTSASITSITFTGANPGDFSQTNTCGGTLGAGNSCNILIQFAPALSGSRTASLNVTDNASGSPQTASLMGTGVITDSFSGASSFVLNMTSPWRITRY